VAARIRHMIHLEALLQDVLRSVRILCLLAPICMMCVFS
jgi:hypothetical protein